MNQYFKVIICLALLFIFLILFAAFHLERAFFDELAFQFGPAEYVSLMVLMLFFSATLLTRSFCRGIASALTGSLLSLVNSPIPRAIETRFNSLTSYGLDDLSLVIFPACVGGALISLCLHFSVRPLRKNSAFLSFRWLPVVLVFVMAYLCFDWDDDSFGLGMVTLSSVIGYIFIKLGVEPAPLLFGFNLGLMMEENLRRAMLLSRGDWSVFVTRPLSAGLLAAALLLLIIVALPSIKSKREEAFVEE